MTSGAAAASPRHSATRRWGRSRSATKSSSSATASGCRSTKPHPAAPTRMRSSSSRSWPPNPPPDRTGPADRNQAPTPGSWGGRDRQSPVLAAAHKDDPRTGSIRNRGRQPGAVAQHSQQRTCSSRWHCAHAGRRGPAQDRAAGESGMLAEPCRSVFTQFGPHHARPCATTACSASRRRSSAWPGRGRGSPAAALSRCPRPATAPPPGPGKAEARYDIPPRSATH